MKSNNIIIEKTLIEIGINDKNPERVITRLASRLLNLGYVKDSFTQAVIDREKTFPTGLPFKIGVAIPHTDAEHVVENAIALGTLTKPVSFIEMGSDNKIVEVSIICLLAIKDPKMVIDTLRNLINVFQDEKILEKIIHAKMPEEIVDVLKNKLSQNNQ